MRKRSASAATSFTSVRAQQITYYYYGMKRHNKKQPVRLAFDKDYSRGVEDNKDLCYISDSRDKKSTPNTCNVNASDPEKADGL
jgi:hypothetical protein